MKPIYLMGYDKGRIDGMTELRNDLRDALEYRLTLAGFTAEQRYEVTKVIEEETNWLD